jgi:hypothetical protein
MPLVFSYGSNNPKQIADRTGAPARALYAAVAPGYKRVFRGWSNTWNGGVATIVPSTSRPAYGLVADLSDAQVRELDKYEGVGSGYYTKETIPVTIYDYRTPGPQTVRVLAYIKNGGAFNPPSRAYLKSIVKTIGTFWEIDGPDDIKVE